jgi:hypothetical protein
MLDDYDGCRTSVKITDTGSMSTYQKLCYVLQKIAEFIVTMAGFESQIAAKEDSVNITNNRKLSEQGDFTGTLDGKKSASQVIYEIDDNKQKLDYLTSQFSEGATGLVIDCGLFDETEIDKQYDGGVW